MPASMSAREPTLGRQKIEAFILLLPSLTMRRLHLFFVQLRSAGRKQQNESLDLFLPAQPPARAPKSRRAWQRPRPELYQKMLKELTELIKLADDLGYNSVSFTEHHFHIEGFELSNNPVLLDLYFAMQTKRIRVGQLGIVLPAANPIHIAEDIAMLDHMTGGRACAGFARGYQRRWVDIMAQQTHGVSGTLPHQHDDIDRVNREAFEENWQIIKKCWTEEMLTFDGKFWKVPAGATPWDTRDHGEVRQGCRERHVEGGRRRAEAAAEALSAGVLAPSHHRRTASAGRRPRA